MAMPIHLRWGGGLGGSVHGLQVVATWAKLNPTAREVRLPEAFAAQENTRERFASTLQGMSALYFASAVNCGGRSLSRSESLGVVIPRVAAMQSGDYRDTLRGQGAALCCFVGAKNEFLAPIYARAESGGLRGESEFQILLPRILKSIGVRDGALNEGQRAYISQLVHQLLLNADEHGSYDVDGDRYKSGIRGLAIRTLSIPDVSALMVLAGEDPALKTYLIKSSIRGDGVSAKFANRKEENLPPMQIVEISVFDTGPGLALRWLSQKEGISRYEQLSLEQEMEAVQTCFRKHQTSRASQFKGEGLNMALMALRRLGAFMTLRTGRLSLFQDFSSIEMEEFRPKHRFYKQHELPEIAGTGYSVCFRVN